jgi:hypothetical protein
MELVAPPPVSTVSGERLREKRGGVAIVRPGAFDASACHYPRVLNAQQHPAVQQFMGMSRSTMIARYCVTHPSVSEASLSAVLRHSPAHFKWAGCDLFLCGPERRALVVETNSCPSGQKSLPFADGDELNGYGRLMRTAFASLLPRGAIAGSSGGGSGASADAARPGATDGGVLVVMYDKNQMEATGYASALAELSGEPVYLAEFYLTDPDPPLRWDAAGRLFVRPAPGAEWLPARAALRYVTQKPWTRLPVTPATPLLNPLLPCLAGGRNKMLAARAYDSLNARLAREGSSLRLLTPATLGDVRKEAIPALVARMGGCAVVKVPYGNAGQGVYTITCSSELTAFMAEKQGYDKFVVQQLVGGRRWGEAAEGAAVATAAAAAPVAAGSSAQPELRFERAYHLGTVPNARGKTFVFDLRMMVVADEHGFKPCSMYARRAAAALSESAPADEAAAAETASDGARSHRASVSSLESAYTVASSLLPPAGGAKAQSASWLQLGTNLSVLTGDLTWSTESERLIMMDTRDFATLGLGVDDLIDAFVQSCLAVIAIDDQAASLLNADGSFSLDKFAAVNDDPALLAELMAAAPPRMVVG